MALLIENYPRLRRLAESKMLSPEGLSMHMDVIQFMDKSRNVAVGKGAREHLASHSHSQDADLVDRSGYNDFVKNNGRKVLSNFFPSVVKVGGRMYPSVEHAFHAGKGYLINSANSIKEAEKFEVGGEYETIEGAKLKGKGGKRGGLKMNEKQVKDWDNESIKIMKEAISYKYKNDSLFRKVLKDTGKALLIHAIRGKIETRISKILMDLRDSRSRSRSRSRSKSRSRSRSPRRKFPQDATEKELQEYYEYMK
jgi:predicted NAD-dependent protein-ADP-ribosyltransferase YbiA (DUF1768 family)